MILPYTKIVGLPIFDLKNQSQVGVVKDVIIQVKDFKVSGVIIEGSFFDRKTKVVSGTDIVDIASQGVIVNNEDAVSTTEENVRLKDAIKNGYYGVGQKVVTKGGKGIGRVIDLFISSETLEISKIHVKSVLTERIISRTAIVKVQKRKIIVKDNFDAVKLGAPAMGPSVI